MPESDARSVVQPVYHRTRPPLTCFLTSTCAAGGSDNKPVFEGRPVCHAGTAKVKKNEITEAEKIAVEREHNLREAESFNQNLRDDPKLNNNNNN